MEKPYDLLVIGTGSAASRVSGECRAAGWTVAVVDSRPFGGTCALRGCAPKKVVTGAAEIVDRQLRIEGKGVRAGATAIDWPDLMAFKRTFTDPVPAASEERFLEQGIDAYHGRARFTGPLAVEVGDQALQARHVVIATGARPAPLEIPGEALLTTSDEFLELDSLPAEIVFVGGGYISFEFAHGAARAGSKVTILHRGKRPPEGFDPDLVDMLCHRTRSLGIDLHLTTEATAVRRKTAGFASSPARAARSGGFRLISRCTAADGFRKSTISTSRRRASSATNAGWR